MRSILLAALLAISLACTNQAAHAESIVWQESIPVIAKKPVLLYFTSPGCAYCVKMKAGTLTNPQVVQRVKKQFVPVRLDVGKHAATAKALKIKLYPSTVVVHPNGVVVDVIPGYVSTKDFLSRLDVAKTKLQYQDKLLAAKPRPVVK